MLNVLAVAMIISGEPAPAPLCCGPVITPPPVEQPAPTANEQKFDNALDELGAALAELEQAIKERQEREKAINGQ